MLLSISLLLSWDPRNDIEIPPAPGFPSLGNLQDSTCSKAHPNPLGSPALCCRFNPFWVCYPNLLHSGLLFHGSVVACKQKIILNADAGVIVRHCAHNERRSLLAEPRVAMLCAPGSVSRAGSRGFGELICSCVYLLLLSCSETASEGPAAAAPAIVAIYLFRPAWRAQGFYQGISWCSLPDSGVCVSIASQDR